MNDARLAETNAANRSRNPCVQGLRVRYALSSGEPFMARHFTAQHTASGYSAMGGNLKRPALAGARHSRGDIKAAIEAERAKAARMARAKS